MLTCTPEMFYIRVARPPNTNLLGTHALQTSYRSRGAQVDILNLTYNPHTCAVATTTPRTRLYKEAPSWSSEPTRGCAITITVGGR